VNSAPLAERLRAHLETSGLFEGQGEALLAVSGGPDSMAMLDLLSGILPGHRATLCVVHADHGIHEESTAVARQVERVARERYRLPVEVRALGLGSAAGETRARQARYQAFREVQAARGARWLVTAHHADDQAETVLLRILRGSGPAGLAGIPERGPRGLVRPLLPFHHAELVEQARLAGLPVFEDPANQDPRHTRSWVRKALLPLLTERLGAAAVASLLEVRRHAAADQHAWDLVLDTMEELGLQAQEGRFDVARQALGGYDAVLASRLLRTAARRSGLRVGPADADRLVRFARGSVSGRRLELGEGIEAETAFDRLVVRRAEEPLAAATVAGREGTLRYGGFELAWRREPAPERLERTGWTTWIADGPLVVRPPSRGDRLTPLGGVGHRSVSRLMMEARIGRADRWRHPLIARDGQPVWIPGICRADAALPAPGTLAVRMDAAAR
jgi:tRNA(Ile)-lysidine synthase